MVFRLCQLGGQGDGTEGRRHSALSEDAALFLGAAVGGVYCRWGVGAYPCFLGYRGLFILPLIHWFIGCRVGKLDLQAGLVHWFISSLKLGFTVHSTQPTGSITKE